MLNLRGICFILVVGLPLTLLVNGCGADMATIEGQVTVDGKPLEKGEIVFDPADTNSGVSVRARITDGHYRVQSVPGKKIVRISAPRVVEKVRESKAPNAPLVDRTVESLPERFNTKSQLQFEAKDGSNTKDWAVEAIPPG